MGNLVGSHFISIEYTSIIKDSYIWGIFEPKSGIWPLTPGDNTNSTTHSVERVAKSSAEVGLLIVKRKGGELYNKMIIF